MADINDLLSRGSGFNAMDLVQALQQGQEQGLRQRSAEADYGDNRLKALYTQDMLPIQALKLNADVAKEINPIDALRVKGYIGNMGSNALADAMALSQGIAAKPNVTDVQAPQINPTKISSPDDIATKAKAIYESITGKKAPAQKVKGKKVSENDTPSSDLLAYNDSPTMTDAQPAYGPIGSLKLMQAPSDSPQQLGADTVAAQPITEPLSIPAQPQQPSLNIASAHDLMQYARGVPINSLMSDAERQIITQGMGLQAAQLKAGVAHAATLAKDVQDNANKGSREKAALETKANIAQAAQALSGDKAEQTAIMKIVMDMVREDQINKPHASGNQKPVNPLDQEKKIQDTVKDLAKSYESLSSGQKYIPSNQKQLFDAYSSITNPDVKSAFYARYKDKIDKFAPAPTPAALPAKTPAPTDFLSRQEGALQKIQSAGLKAPPGTLSNSLRAMQKNGVSPADIIRIRKQYEGIIP